VRGFSLSKKRALDSAAKYNQEKLFFERDASFFLPGNVFSLSC
jgi:hypothetical protein